jgi:serine phosphatase RsbU (regulator of sigma subunit)
VVRADGSLECVAVRGSLVGWMEDPHFGEADVRLEPGDLMVMFTDGVIEVRGRGAEYGERELDETLRGLAGIGADDAAQAILDRAVATHGGTAPDDIALLVLRVGT